MPSISSRIVQHPTGPVAQRPVASVPKPPLPQGIYGSQPTPIVSPILRCPMPGLTTPANPDNLRQYYAGGTIPQYRLTPPNPINANQSAPVATSSTPGTIVPDGTTVQVTNGVLSVVAAPAVVPPPSSSTSGYPASGGGGGAGSVTSVALTVPSRQTVSGSPITTSGTLAVTDNTQSANAAFIGPASGPAAAPTFRALVAADIPINFVDDETVSGSGTSWTLAYPPAAGCVPILVVQVPSFGGVVLLLGQTPGFTITGANITTTNSYTTGALVAWYRR
jgi:hypothetical protein